jgi:PAS domain S-box-containing protein
MADQRSTWAGWRLKAIAAGKALGAPALVHALATLRGSKLGLRAHLVIFGLAIVVPVLLYAAFLLHRYTESVQAAEERRALQIARSLSTDIDREVTAIITTLQALATADALAVRDFRSFYVQAKEALKSRPWNVVLIDMNRRQLVNTRLEWGVTPPMSTVSEPDLFRIARETGKPYVSDLFIGTVAQHWIFSVSVPVRPRKEVEYVLVMSLEPERLVEVLQSESLPSGWLAAIADRKNVNMARTRDARRFLGRPVPQESVRQYEGRAEGVIRTTDFEGKPSLHAFHFSALTGWRVAAWAPVAVVDAPLREAWTAFVWSGAALLSLSMLLAFGVGRLMAEPIARLRRAGAALGEGRPVSPIVSTLREADEISLVLSDAARQLETRMRAQAHLAAIVSSSPSAIVSLAPDGTIRTWNAAAERLFGYTASEAIGQAVDMLAPEEARQTFEKLYARVRAGETVHADVVRRRKDGRLIDIAINLAPMYDDAGRLVGISSVNRDIGERIARERHIEFLMRELAHRSKNQLAVIQAIAGQTARNSASVAEFQKRFSQRVLAMSISHDLLLAGNWKGAAMADLVRAQLAPFAEETSSRIDISGPDFEVKPEAVQGITLALHELATNAAKYGALSVPEGRVAIAWELRRSAADARLRMSWRESGGPPVTPPERTGFGHVVISQMVATTLHAQVALDYAREGVSWTLDAPLAGVSETMSSPELRPEAALS